MPKCKQFLFRLRVNAHVSLRGLVRSNRTCWDSLWDFCLLIAALAVLARNDMFLCHCEQSEAINRVECLICRCFLSLREALASWQSTVSGFLACCSLAMTNRDATLTLNMTMNIFACAILCHCEAIAEAINKQGIPMILALHTVGCHAS